MLRKFIAMMCSIAIICSLSLCEAKKIVAVMPLENVSGYDEEMVAEIMTEQLIVAIHSSGLYTVVERAQMGTILREQGFQNIAVDQNQAVELGKLSGADYSMIGKVTMAVAEVNPTLSAVTGLGSLLKLEGLGEIVAEHVHKVKGRIALEFRLVDNTTGEIIMAKTVEGSKSGSTANAAFNNACKVAADNFLKELNSINPFRARIAAVNGADIYIDQGSNAGLRVGDVLIVARESEPIVVNGKIVAMKQNDVGKVKVVDVGADYAICRAEGFGNSINQGDIVKRS